MKNLETPSSQPIDNATQRYQPLNEAEIAAARARISSIEIGSKKKMRSQEASELMPFNLAEAQAQIANMNNMTGKRSQSQMEEVAVEPEGQASTAQRLSEAREFVDQVIGATTPEKEVQSTLSELLVASKDRTYIHTDVPSVTLRHGSETRKPAGSGFQTFGDAPNSEYRDSSQLLSVRDAPEAIIFEPNMTTKYRTEKKIDRAAGMFKKEISHEAQVVDSIRPTLVLNGKTGQQEPGVRVAYQFNSQAYGYTNEMPRYDTGGGRPGNILTVETIVPQSVADKFKRLLVDNPMLARQFSEQIVKHNGVSEDVWNASRVPMRPPYDHLPFGWQLAVVDKEGPRVIARKEIKF